MVTIVKLDSCNPKWAYIVVLCTLYSWLPNQYSMYTEAKKKEERAHVRFINTLKFFTYNV